MVSDNDREACYIWPVVLSDAIENYIDGVSEYASVEETYVGCGQAHTMVRGLEHVLPSKGPRSPFSSSGIMGLSSPGVIGLRLSPLGVGLSASATEHDRKYVRTNIKAMRVRDQMHRNVSRRERNSFPLVSPFQI